MNPMEMDQSEHRPRWLSYYNRRNSLIFAPNYNLPFVATRNSLQTFLPGNEIIGILGRSMPYGGFRVGYPSPRTISTAAMTTITSMGLKQGY